MTQEQKDLLLKDLCARLPYELKVQFNYIITSPAILKGINKDFIECDIAVCELEDVKPYLFPLSSMTKEQRKEYEDALVYHDYVKGGWTIAKSFDDEYIIPYWFVDFCNKHHLDYRGLIQLGLAIDATGLNIY